jgi:fermentation-respiration switch protein FrsA (DUF1100 family)
MRTAAGSRRYIRAAARLAAIAIGAWALTACVLWAIQDSMLFHPDTRPLGEPPAASKFARATLITADGLELAFWTAPPEPGQPVIVHFHGNAGNAADRFPFASGFARRGWGYVLAEYRGYGGNPGTPSETGLFEDGRADMRWVEATWGVKVPYLLGESLGGGVAVAMATERPVAALVLDAPFTSVTDIAAGLFPWLPARQMVRNPFDNLSRIPGIRVPLIVFHAERDGVIPVAHGRAVLAAAPGPKTGLFLPGAAHPALLNDRSGKAVEALVKFVEDVEAGRQ